MVLNILVKTKERIMKVYPVTSNYFTGINPVKITKNLKDNKNIKYLYNDVLDVVNDCRIPAVFGNDRIDLPSPTKAALDKLNSLGIAYKIVVKD